MGSGNWVLRGQIIQGHNTAACAPVEKLAWRAGVVKKQAGQRGCVQGLSSTVLSLWMFSFVKLLLGSRPAGDDGMCSLSHRGRPRHPDTIRFLLQHHPESLSWWLCAPLPPEAESDPCMNTFCRTVGNGGTEVLLLRYGCC